jgi:hypothetical protein
MFAITAHTRDREAYLREVERYGQAFPKTSYGRRNDQAIAAREARLAARLRAVEHAYQTVLDHDQALTATQHARALRVADHIPDWEMEQNSGSLARTITSAQSATRRHQARAWYEPHETLYHVA